jgi:hypothetical protein
VAKLWRKISQCANASSSNTRNCPAKLGWTASWLVGMRLSAGIRAGAEQPHLPPVECRAALSIHMPQLLPHYDRRRRSSVARITQDSLAHIISKTLLLMSPGKGVSRLRPAISATTLRGMRRRPLRFRAL